MKYIKVLTLVIILSITSLVALYYDFLLEYLDWSAYNDQNKQITYEDRNEIYLVAGTSGSGKSSFVGSICKNLLNFEGVGCNHASFTSQVNVYSCINQQIFGSKIVKVVDTPGLHDTFNRDEYFSKKM